MQSASSQPIPALIHGLTRDELAEVLTGLNFPAFRATQVWQWLYSKYVIGWDEMKNLPAADRLALAKHFTLESVHPLRTDGEPSKTRKILGELADHERIEEVLIPAADRRTVCVSSQVGCKFRCTFCASGQSGFTRDLQVGEMVGQVILAAREFGDRPTHVVFMGIGEPLDNYDNTLKAIRLLNDPDGLHIGARRITISTSGVIPGIQRLADEGLQVELSVSLHAANDATRSRLMPINQRYPLKDLLKACRAYAKKTNRLITFEYTLIRGVNDSPAHARDLALACRQLTSRVNLLLLNPVKEFDGVPPPSTTADDFIRVLKQAGINATLRASKGGAVHAACGQLRTAAKVDLACSP